MFNPADHDTTNSLISYRHEQLRIDRKHPEGVADAGPVFEDAPWSFPVRRSIGLSLMRIGARLAGVSFHARVGMPL